ncbi:MAG: CopG family transcriptional regulator [Candidatus Thermoplasmatota archaeon]|nr:CopG family transcriptional regulator [Candidatus Thermoplasmatota archaeon]
MPEEKETKKYTTISIPTPLAEKIKQRIEGTGFHSLSSYVTYVLREVISNVEEEDQDEAFSKEDEEKVKERLRALGYLD